MLLEEEPEPLGERPVEAEVAAPRVTTLTRGALQEVRRTPRPSPVTVAVLEAVCQLLGHPKPPFANAAAKRAGKKTREWSQIQAIMTSATFLQRVLKYDPMEHLESGELSFDDFVRIEREYIEPIDPAEVTTASMAVVSLYEWAHAAVHIVKHSHDPDFDARLMPPLPRDTKLSFNQHKRIAGASLGRSNSLERAASSGYGLQRQNTPADVSNGGGGRHASMLDRWRGAPIAPPSHHVALSPPPPAASRVRRCASTPRGCATRSSRSRRRGGASCCSATRRYVYGMLEHAPRARIHAHARARTCASS